MYVKGVLFILKGRRILKVEVSASSSKSSVVKSQLTFFRRLLMRRYDENMNDHDSVDEANDNEHLRERLGDIKQIT